MGLHGYVCGFGSLILFAGFVVLVFGLVPNSQRKLDPECYTECEYGVSEYRKDVKEYCKAAAAFCITLGFFLCLAECVAWRCRHGDCSEDERDLGSARIEEQTLVDLPESSYHYTSSRDGRTPINDDYISSTRHNREYGNNHSRRYYDGSTAPLADGEELNFGGNEDGNGRNANGRSFNGTQLNTFFVNY